MTDLQRNTDHQCQCAQCRASRALDVLRALPSLPDDGRAALDTIEAALNELEEGGFARWEAMNDVATAAGLNWMDATQQDIVDAIKQARARVAELESQLAAQQWRPIDEPAPKGDDAMTRTPVLAAAVLALALVACGGGGTNNGDGVWEYVATACADNRCPTPAPWELPTATPNGRPTADATATAETLICPPPVDGHRVLCLIAPEATAAALATAAAEGMATQEVQP